jgi:hypothetical protein
MSALETVPIFLLAYGVSLYVWLYLRIICHEYGHVIVGKFLGFAPYGVKIGKGSEIFRFRFLGVETEILASPMGGITLSSLLPMNGIRWRGALFALAGPAADFLLLLALLMVAINPWIDRGSGVAATVLGYLMLFQGMGILSSIWPRDVFYAGSTHPNDGKMFFQYFSGQVTRAFTAYQSQYQASVQSDDPNFRIEESWLIKVRPQSFRVLRAVERSQADGRYHEMCDGYLAILESPLMTNGERARYLDCLACIALIHGQMEFKGRALAWAKEAHQLFPKSPTLRGTYGGALVANGEYALGVEMLTPLTSQENQPIDRSISACYLAKAHHHLGNAAEAKTLLELGKSLNASCGVCERIEKELKGLEDLSAQANVGSSNQNFAPPPSGAS